MQNLSYDTLMVIEDALERQIKSAGHTLEWAKAKDPNNDKLPVIIERGEKMAEALEVVREYQTYIANHA